MTTDPAAAEKDEGAVAAFSKAIDLNRWLSGSYVIPGTEEEPSAPDTGEEN